MKARHIIKALTLASITVVLFGISSNIFAATMDIDSMSAVEITSTSVKVSFHPANSSPSDSYKAYRSTTELSDIHSAANQSSATSISGTSGAYTFTGLNPNTTYFLYICVNNNAAYGWSCGRLEKKTKPTAAAPTTNNNTCVDRSGGAHCSGWYIVTKFPAGNVTETSFPQSAQAKQYPAFSSKWGLTEEQINYYLELKEAGRIVQAPSSSDTTVIARYPDNTSFLMSTDTNKTGPKTAAGNTTGELLTPTEVKGLVDSDTKVNSVNRWYIYDKPVAEGGKKMSDTPFFVEKNNCLNPLAADFSQLNRPDEECISKEEWEEKSEDDQKKYAETDDGRYCPIDDGSGPFTGKCLTLEDLENLTPEMAAEWVKEFYQQIIKGKNPIATRIQALGRDVRDAYAAFMKDFEVASPLDKLQQLKHLLDVIKECLGEIPLALPPIKICGLSTNEFNKYFSSLLTGGWKDIVNTIKQNCPPPGSEDEEEPDGPEGGDDGRHSGYTVLTEVRNMTKDGPGVENWKNWDYNYQVIDVFPLNIGWKNFGNGSTPNAYVCGSTTIPGDPPTEVQVRCPEYYYYVGSTKNTTTNSTISHPGNPAATFKILSDSPKDYVLAKPTDYIQFRHTLEKGWWDFQAENDNYAPARTNPSGPLNVGETCTVTHNMLSGSGSNLNELEASNYVRRESRIENSFLKTYSCVGGGWGTTEKKHNLIPGLTPNFPESGYEIRTHKSQPGVLVVKNDDVGKIFEQQIATFPTWAHEEDFKCTNPIDKNVSGASGSRGASCTTGSWKTTRVAQGGNGASSARAYVPYNYGTRPTITANPPVSSSGCNYPKSVEDDAKTGDDAPGCQDEYSKSQGKAGWPNYGLVYAGESFHFSSNIIINSRSNPDVDAFSPYATYTKPTKYQVVSFAATPDSNAPKGYGTGPDTQVPCDYYSGSTKTHTEPAGRACVALSNPLTNKVYNPNGSLDTAGTGITNALESTSVVIDDLPVGTKICFAVAVFPADSHNKPDQPLGSPEPNNLTAAMTEYGAQWAYGAPYCVTIAKKPNFQVWGSGVYTGGGLNTSQSPKLIADTGNPVYGTNGNNAANNNMLLQSESGNDVRTIFGSWSEWEVVSLGSVVGFSSGASFGYTALSANKVQYGGGLSGFSTNSDGTLRDTNLLCATTKMTLGNSSCNALLPSNRSAGNVDVRMGTMANLLLTQITLRYAGAGTIGAGPSSKNRNTYHIDYRNYDDYMALPPGDIPVPSGRVHVYDLRGRGEVEWTHNIHYADSRITHADGIATSDKYLAISELPQAIIFANDLNIAPNVTHMDAWIILTGDGIISGNGELNTCSQDLTRAADCSNPLTINGPIYASSIVLNRTYGAFPGSQTCFNGYNGTAPSATNITANPMKICTDDNAPGGWKGSVAPAERFILRADTLMWAYAQASQVPTAVSVHTYEPSVNF